ncbi:MAG TPA: hypothetical protein V6C69_12460 [Trichormus sp.]|jgi:hypothetical protein
MAHPGAFESQIASSAGNTSEFTASRLFESAYTPDTTPNAQPMRASENVAAGDTTRADIEKELEHFHAIGGAAAPKFSTEELRMHSDLFPENERAGKTDKQVLEKLQEAKSFVHCTSGDNPSCTPYIRK